MGLGKGKKDAARPKAPVDEFSAALDWEAARTSLLEKSQARAWRIAWVAVLTAVLPWVAIVLMMPLKQTVPYVIRVDNATGVPDIVTTMNHKDLAYDEVMDKYWVARYVRARQTYDWYTLQDDYDTVGMLSDGPIAKVYAAQFSGENGLDKKNGNRVRVVTKILSVVPSGNGSATVRFVTQTSGTDSAGAAAVTNWVATVAYKYRNPSMMKESYRLVNPFGFQVMSYRVDPELVGGTTSAVSNAGGAQ